MTAITARGWPGLARYKSPEGRQAKSTPLTSLRSYDLWLLLEWPVVKAYSGHVELSVTCYYNTEGYRFFCDPLGTVKTHPYGLWRAYQPNCAIVGYDLGYQLGQLAEFWQTTRSGAFRIFPYGWGKQHTRGRIIKVSPHRPPLIMRPRAKGWHVQFDLPASGKPGEYGKWVDGKPFRGNFIDLQSVERALGA